MYAEEVDLCWRLGRTGWAVRFAPVTDVVRHGAASTKPLRGTMAVHPVA